MDYTRYRKCIRFVKKRLIITYMSAIVWCVSCFVTVFGLRRGRRAYNDNNGVIWKERMSERRGDNHKNDNAGETVMKPSNLQVHRNSNATRSGREVLKKEETIDVGTEMYALMLNDPRMRAGYGAESDFKESDVPLIKAGYF